MSEIFRLSLIARKITQNHVVSAVGMAVANHPGREVLDDETTLLE